MPVTAEPASTRDGSPDPGVAGVTPTPRLAAGALWRLAASFSRVLLGLVSVPLFTGALGMWQWGLLALFQAAAAPLVLLELGAGAATVKQVSEHLGRGDRAAAARAVQTTMLFHVAIGLAGLALLVLLADPLATSVFAVPVEQQRLATAGFRLVGVSWMLALAGSSLLGVLSAHQRFDLVATMGTLGTFATTGAGLAAALTQRSVLAVLVAQAAAALLMLGASFALAARLLPELRAPPRWSGASFRATLSFGAGQAFAVAGNLVVAWSDRYVLGTRLAPALVGFYVVAQSLQAQLQSAFYDLAEMLFPAVSHRVGAGTLPAARQLTLAVGWTVAMGFGVAATTLATAGGAFLRLWLSPEASAASTEVLRLLCTGGIFVVSALAPSFYVLGVGRTRWHATSTLLSGAAAVTTSLVLVPASGIAAVGWGLVAGGVVRAVLAGFIWRACFARDVTLGAFAAHVWAPPLASALLVGVLSYLHDRFVDVSTWPMLFLDVAAVLAVAAAALIGLDALVPGARARRRAVLDSFRPVLERALGGKRARSASTW